MHEQAIKNVMLLNAEQLRALRARVKETSKNRSSDEGSVQWQRWRDAGQEFHLRYDSLAFPGGLSVQWPKLIAGDPGTIDVALCFLECRPYYFRSGYHWSRILRRLKRASLSHKQAARLQAVVDRRADWQKQHPTLNARRRASSTRDQIHTGDR